MVQGLGLSSEGAAYLPSAAPPSSKRTCNPRPKTRMAVALRHRLHKTRCNGEDAKRPRHRQLEQAREGWSTQVENRLRTRVLGKREEVNAPATACTPAWCNPHVLTSLYHPLGSVAVALMTPFTIHV